VFINSVTETVTIRFLILFLNDDAFVQVRFVWDKMEKKYIIHFFLVDISGINPQQKSRK